MHANHFDFGAHGLDVVSHAADQTTAANRHKHGIELVQVEALQLAQHFHGNRALACNHIGVVKRVDKGHAVFLFERECVGVGVGVAVACQHHFATQSFDRFNLHAGRGSGHDDDGFGA